MDYRFFGGPCLFRESVQKVFLTQIGIGKHSFATDIIYLPVELCQTVLTVAS